MIILLNADIQRWLSMYLNVLHNSGNKLYILHIKNPAEVAGFKILNVLYG